MGIQEKDPLAQLSLPPGFRFFPTDEELMVQYLCRKVSGHNFSLQIIAEIDLYKFDPWDLPCKALFGEKEWYFFSPRDRKYPNGSRPNRVAGSGYWKATGTDKVITTNGRKVGIKKALVFYVGKAPKGTKTNWIMHEYRLTEPTRKQGSSKLDDWVLCRIYKKNSGGPKPELSRDYSTGGSCDSSSSHIDDVMDSLAEIDNRSFDVKAQENNNNNFKYTLQQFGSGNIDWAALAGLTQPNSNTTSSYDMHVPSMPPLAHMESPVDNKSYVSLSDEEVQNAIRTERVNSEYYTNNSNVLAHSYADSVDPFGFGFGFGFGQ